MTEIAMNLPAILASHLKWLRNEIDGSRANLSGADLSRADLSWVNLSGAYLSRTILTGANLTGANVIDAGHRSDGYRFIGSKAKDGTIIIKAGCRFFSVADARAHWQLTRSGTQLGNESLALVDHIERMAGILGWTSQ